MHFMLSNDKFKLLTYTSVLEVWKYIFLGALRQVNSVSALKYKKDMYIKSFRKFLKNSKSQ